MKHLFLFTLTLFFSFTLTSTAFGQVFWEDNFESTAPNLGGGVRAAPNHANTTDGSNTDICGPNDYFFRTDCNTTSSTPGQNCAGISDVFTGGSGFMWRGEDLDGCLADPDIINFTGIDISGKSNLVFKGLFAADDDANDWEGVDAADGHSDQLLVAYQIDGGGYTTGIVFRSDGSDHENTEDNRGLLRVDTDDDGFGDGPLALGLAFQEFSFNIPGSGATLDLRFEAFVNNGGEEFAIDLFQLEEGTVPAICPSLGLVELSESMLCANIPFDITISGMSNMASATNNDQDYGISFVAFDSTPADPYLGGTNLGTVPFGSLTDSGTAASINGASLAVAGSYTVYAILSPVPGDLACRPSVVSAGIEVLPLNAVTIMSPGDFCVDDILQNGLSGGLPAGGVYSGVGVTDDGNGMTYSFDPAAAGEGMHTISYMGECSTAGVTIEVFALPAVGLTALGPYSEDAGIQSGLGGGTPEGGIYSGTGVTDDGNGMTYSFDPAVAGIGTHIINYSYTDSNGCANSASDEVIVEMATVITCPEGDVLLLSQADVAAYVADYPNCPEIAGNLKIGNGYESTDISDLSGLSDLTTIGGRLSFFFNGNLSSFQGLNALTSVGGGLYIFRNNALSSMTGLDALTSVGGELYILLNDNLSSLSGLNSLSTIGANLIIRTNNGLLELTGLDMLNSIGGFLDITSNTSLNSLLGLSSLTSIDGNLVIRTNASLTDLQGLENIDPAGINKLYIVGNSSLTNCAIESICAYLGDDANFANIARNTNNCNNRIRVEDACLDLSMEEVAPGEAYSITTMDSNSTTEAASHRDAPAIKLYPNPTSGLLQMRNIEEVQRVLVFNPQGQQMIKYETPTRELDLSTLPAGVYYLNFITAEDRYTVRLVKVD